MYADYEQLVRYDYEQLVRRLRTTCSLITSNLYADYEQLVHRLYANCTLITFYVDYEQLVLTFAFGAGDLARWAGTDRFLDMMPRSFLALLFHRFSLISVNLQIKLILQICYVIDESFDIFEYAGS